MDKLSLGIDLGTTNSCLAVLDGTGPRAVPDEQGEPITPSVVAIRPEGVLVGRQARRFLLTNPAETFVSIKRKMGERYARTVQGKEYTPESVSSLILGHMRRYGEKHLGRALDDVVITVPANFNSIQRQATKDAGDIAGFNVLRVINEPTAAALAYGHEKHLSSVLVVFDLGGGTFDISVVEAGEGLYEVIYSVGDNHLGGDDFNLRIVNWIVHEFQEQTSFDIRRDVRAMQVVHEWAIAAKHGLTDAPEVRITIDDLYKGKGFDGVLTRENYLTLCSDLFDRLRSITANVCEEMIKPRYADTHPGLFENRLAGCDILLTGGETRVPAVRELVAQAFQGRLHSDASPDQVVALGAAIQAGIILKKGGVQDIVLVDTTALSLGVEMRGGVFSRLIEAHTPIPCTRTKEYTPELDMQDAVMVRIYQGESEMCEKNVKLGQFEFLLQPPRPRHDATVQVTFHLDANDILHASAVDVKTGARQSITIKDSQNLDRAEVERLRRAAQQSSREDQARAQRIHKHSRWRDFHQDVMSQVKALERLDPGNKFLRKAAEYAQRLERCIASEDDAAMEQAAGDLEAAWQKVLAVIPEIQRKAPPAAPVPPSAVAVSGGDGGAAAGSMPASAYGAAASGVPAGTPAGGPPGIAASASVADRAGASPGAGGAAGLPADAVNCAHCGARLPRGFAFCGKCGMPLKSDTCMKCGAALIEGFAFCGKCGTKV